MDAPGPRPQSDTVADFWTQQHRDAAGGAHDNYLIHPLVQAYVSLRAFGTLTNHIDAAAHALRGYTEPGDTIISLGCGAAGKEQIMAQALPDRKLVGIDIAGPIIESAREQIAAAGITNLEVRHGDFNELELEPRSFKVLLGLGAIHHVENLEGMWAQARHGLQAGGVVLAQEFVGPDRMQWTDAQIAACDHALETLVPDEHKTSHRRVERVDLDYIIAMDPSEAVRSSEIVPTCRDAGYQIEALASAGGALLQPVLMNQIQSYHPQNWSHNLVLSRLFEEESRLMAEGVLEDDFVMMVARPPAD